MDQSKHTPFKALVSMNTGNHGNAQMLLHKKSIIQIFLKLEGVNWRGQLKGFFVLSMSGFWRVWDFCFSLSDLSELKQALNFPSLACHCFILTGRRIQNHKLPLCCRFAHSFRILSWNSASQPPPILFHILSKHLTNWKLQSIALEPGILWKGDLPEHFLLLCHFT